jgi:hypothetical protein
MRHALHHLLPYLRVLFLGQIVRLPPYLRHPQSLPCLQQFTIRLPLPHPPLKLRPLHLLAGFQPFLVPPLPPRISPPCQARVQAVATTIRTRTLGTWMPSWPKRGVWICVTLAFNPAMMLLTIRSNDATHSPTGSCKASI